MQTGCSLLGCGLFQNSPLWDFSSVGGLIRTGVTLIFALIIVYGIFMVIKASLRIIRSEGDPTKVQEGFSIVKGVMLGFIIIFIGIIGMVVVIYFFGAGKIVDTDPTIPDGVNIPL